MSSSCAFIDDLFQCFTDFTTGIIRHTAQFVRQFLTHEFIERLSENIGLPNLLRLFLKLAEQIVYQFFRLLFRADDRIDLGFDVGPGIIWMDGAEARRRTPYRPPCRTISGSSSESSSTDGITMP